MVLVVAAAMLVLPGVAHAGTVHGDFNGDGYADLAVGVPWEDLGSLHDAGAVQVLYGSANGVTSSHNQLWHRNAAGVLGSARSGADFGSVLESADYTGDGYADLAIAAGNQVQLLRGSAMGLTATNDQVVVLSAQIGSFAAGDFTGNGRTDLAVGLPRVDVGDQSGAGIVQVLRGSKAGLAPLTGQQWSQNSPGILNASSPGDGFGSSLAAGDFDQDGHADLAIGVPGESIHIDGREVELSGAVNVLRGATGGLTATGNRFFILGSPGMPEAVGWGEQYFGTALAAGDFDGDGFVDLAASAPEENPDISIAGHGLVVTLYGTGAGLTSNRAQELRQPGGIIGDNFGWSLAAADFNGDGLSDLGIGSPQDEPATQGLFADWGSVVMMYATAGTGITPTGAADLGPVLGRGARVTQPVRLLRRRHRRRRLPGRRRGRPRGRRRAGDAGLVDWFRRQRQPAPGPAWVGHLGSRQSALEPELERRPRFGRVRRRLWGQLGAVMGSPVGGYAERPRPATIDATRPRGVR